MEAKSEGKNPLAAKEQARRYAREQNARFVILSNGNIHYLWDLKQGNPSVITKFPGPGEIRDHHAFQPDAKRLASEIIDRDYIALTQMPGYANEAGWNSEAERPAFIEKTKLRFLRDYQKKAVRAVQRAAKGGAVRFLFEMATGTGKTLTSAAIIKLFLKTGNALRVLFLVDRIELEVQASPQSSHAPSRTSTGPMAVTLRQPQQVLSNGVSATGVSARPLSNQPTRLSTTSRPTFHGRKDALLESSSAVNASKFTLLSARNASATRGALRTQSLQDAIQRA